jgi:nucleolin
MSRDYTPYEDELERTVFVNGLAYESTEDDIRYFFEECGDIERINLPRYQNSDRNIGYCHVRFTRRRYARRALKLSGKYLDKRYLKIEMAQDLSRRGGQSGGYSRYSSNGCKLVYKLIW